MGISGLLPLLKEIQVHGNIKDFRGKRLAVDAYVWLHKGAFGCAEDLVKGKKTTKFVDYAMYRVRLLRHHGITPYIVFDGGPLPAKKGTEVSRAKSRAENLARATSLESQGRHKEARDYYTKCVDITPEMAYQLIKALRAEGIDYVVAPYEADAQLYFLEREGYVDGIITEDSDLLVFGCRQVIFKLDGEGNCVSIHRDRLASIGQLPMHGWTDVQFRRMAMLSGCDYLPSIQGMGLKTAHRMLRKHKTVEKLLQNLRMDGIAKIPDGYIQSFNQAELAFMHQRIYDPALKRLMPLNPFPEGGLGDADERWIGLDVDEVVAQGMARGDLHPETRIAIEDQWPDFKPVALGQRSEALRKASSSSVGPKAKAAAPIVRGPMDAFLSGSGKKVALPKPVGANSSGPSRLADLCPNRSPISRGISAPGRLESPAKGAKTTSGTGSKFFGTKGSKAAETKAMAKWPSQSREVVEDSQVPLVWQDSSQAGPEVEFDSPTKVVGSPVKGDRVGEKRKRVDDVDDEGSVGVASGLERGKGGGGWLSDSLVPVVSSLIANDTSSPPPTTPAENNIPESLEYRSPTPAGALTNRHDPVSHPSPYAVEGPQLSSPPNCSLSPPDHRPPPTHLKDTPLRPAPRQKREYSTPPDTGRQRSMTVDPFMPSPPPPQIGPKTQDDWIDVASFETPTRPVRSERVGKLRERTLLSVKAGVVHVGTLNVDVLVDQSSPLEPRPENDSSASGLHDRAMAAERFKRAKRDLGLGMSSDSILDEEDIVTPSYDAGRTAANERNGQRAPGRRPGPVPHQAAVLGDSVVLDHDDVRVGGVERDEDEEELEREKHFAEEKRREREAKAVASGWREKFALKVTSIAGRRYEPSNKRPRFDQPARGSSASVPIEPTSATSIPMPIPRSISAGAAARPKAPARVSLSLMDPSRILGARSPNVTPLNTDTGVGNKPFSVRPAVSPPSPKEVKEARRLAAAAAAAEAGNHGEARVQVQVEAAASKSGGSLARFKFGGGTELVDFRTSARGVL